MRKSLFLLCFLANSLLKADEFTDSVEMERFFLEAYSTANISSAEDMLHQSILNDSREGIREALQEGANVHKGKDGKAPILYAVLLKKSNAVDELLNFGANPSITYAGYNLVLHAVKQHDIDSALSLVKADGRFDGYINNQQISVMDYVISIISGCRLESKADPLELIQELINHGYNIHSSSWNSNIWYSAINAPLNVLNLFLKNGADPRKTIDTSDIYKGSYTTSLIWAIYNNNTYTAKFLLDAGVSINQIGHPFPHYGGPFSPLEFAVKFRPNMVAFLIENGASL